MLCRLLGPLEVRAGESWTAVSAPKWRVLLAVLLLRPGQVVSTGQLSQTELWSDDPPLRRAHPGPALARADLHRPQQAT